jgi:4-amino-4-deoxy-L-arabinose transferase-like glycosyltransferase
MFLLVGVGLLFVFVSAFALLLGLCLMLLCFDFWRVWANTIE